MSRSSSFRALGVAAAILSAALAASHAAAQVPVTTTDDQQAWLKSDDPKLAANKKLVFDMWRNILDAGQVDQAPKYLAEDYIQHNPNVATGRAAVVDFFSKFVPRKPVQDEIKDLVSIVAEGDLVVLSFLRTYPDPKDATKTYTTTWFDMFRVKDGLIVEHWDSSTKL